MLFLFLCIAYWTIYEADLPNLFIEIANRNLRFGNPDLKTEFVEMAYVFHNLRRKVNLPSQSTARVHGPSE